MYLKNFSDLAKENGRKAIIRCIELKGLKNPDKIEEIKDNTFSHTNTRGKKHFICFSIRLMIILIGMVIIKILIINYTK